jgi:hypothetical protein
MAGSRSFATGSARPSQRCRAAYVLGRRQRLARTATAFKSGSTAAAYALAGAERRAWDRPVRQRSREQLCVRRGREKDVARRTAVPASSQTASSALSKPVHGQASLEMARPGLEPGTPRSSGTRIWAGKRRKSPANRRVAGRARGATISAVCRGCARVKDVAGRPRPLRLIHEIPREDRCLGPRATVGSDRVGQLLLGSTSLERISANARNPPESQATRSYRVDHAAVIDARR